LVTEVRSFHDHVEQNPNLIFLLLTKRPSNINKYIPEAWKDNPPANVMYGASVVDQQSANDVARAFSKVNGSKFLSVEPLLEEIDMAPFCYLV
jgi:protein gp37